MEMQQKFPVCILFLAKMLLAARAADSDSRHCQGPTNVTFVKFVISMFLKRKFLMFLREFFATVDDDDVAMGN